MKIELLTYRGNCHIYYVLYTKYNTHLMHTLGIIPTLYNTVSILTQNEQPVKYGSTYYYIPHK